MDLGTDRRERWSENDNDGSDAKEMEMNFQASLRIELNLAKHLRGTRQPAGCCRLLAAAACSRVPLVEMLAIPGIPAFPHSSLPEATPANAAAPMEAAKIAGKLGFLTWHAFIQGVMWILLF